MTPSGHVDPGSGQTETDRELARRLRDLFESDLRLADVQAIHFYVREGTVTLHGIVHHTLDRELLGHLVEQVDGVDRVQNNLDIRAKER